MGDGDSGGFAIDNWATMPDNNTVTAAIIGNILEESSVWDSDWFRFDTSDDAAADSVNGSNNFNFEVTLTQGAGTYSVVVYRGGYSSTQLQCAGLQNSGYTEYNYFSQDVGDGTHTAPAVTNECGPIGDPVHNVCEDLSDVFYVEVLRDPTAAASCLPYEIVVTNGAP
jgi:hypothetical protein